MVFRFTLPGNQIVDVQASSEAAACVALEVTHPGMSGKVLRLERLGG